MEATNTFDRQGLIVIKKQFEDQDNEFLITEENCFEK